jgi:chemotaxis protein CheY-P-specific phosphatase CheC
MINSQELIDTNKRLKDLDIPPLTIANNPRLDIVGELLDIIDTAEKSLLIIKELSNTSLSSASSALRKMNNKKYPSFY